MYTDRQGGITYTFANINNFLANNAQSVQYLGDLSAPSPFFNNSTGQAHAKQDYYITYAQDEWKIKPNLTLNYGLRYEYYTPLREANDRQILFDIITGTLRDSIRTRHAPLPTMRARSVILTMTTVTTTLMCATLSI